MTTEKPKDRNTFSFKETMKKYYGGLEGFLYAAEVLCPERTSCDGCSFQIGCGCKLHKVREIMGDHIVHSDIKTCTGTDLLEDCFR